MINEKLFVLTMIKLLVTLCFIHTSILVNATTDNSPHRSPIQSIETWKQEIRAHQVAGELVSQVETQLRLSEAYFHLGHYPKADKVLHDALKLVELTQQVKQKARILGSLGRLYTLYTPPNHLLEAKDQACRYLLESIILSETNHFPAIAALSKLHLGYWLLTQQKYPEARTAFEKSFYWAHQNEHELLAIQASINKVVLDLKEGKQADAKKKLVKLLEQSQSLPDSHDKMRVLMKVGELLQNFDEHRLASYQAFNGATNIAQSLGEQRALSQATGHLGHLYEKAGRYQEAIKLTKQAIFFAQAAQAPEWLFRWLWQQGRLLKAQNQAADAINSYQQAVDVLECSQPTLPDHFLTCPLPFRQDMMNTYHTLGQTSFYERFSPLFLELADLYLQQARVINTSDEKQQDSLRRAREVIEQLKANELRDYFQDDCIDEFLRHKVETLDNILERIQDTKTAIIYPILLTDRIELLVTLPKQEQPLQSFSVPIGRQEIRKTIKTFREQLTSEDSYWDESKTYLTNAKQLYEWLIEPLTLTLTQWDIHTLVFVPEGPLLTIPMATLHDGHQFLIEQYALAITAGLKLTAPKMHPLRSVDKILLGASKKGLNYPIDEIEEIARLFTQYPEDESDEKNLLIYITSSTDFTKNNHFTKYELEKSFTNRSALVHLASHAQFSESPQNSFLQIKEDKLSFDELEKLVKKTKFREIPIELLTLSACETATGGNYEKTTLGLSGMTVKAGARSVLGSLWAAGDDATKHLMIFFYQNLQKSMSKAQALQAAQKKLLDSKVYGSHPYDWAPFLIIGNWL